MNSKTFFIRERDKDRIDPNLDTPSEANSKKHLNFLDVEEEIKLQNTRKKDEFSEDRKKQWQEGIAQGKEERRNSD